MFFQHFFQCPDTVPVWPHRHRVRRWCTGYWWLINFAHARHLMLGAYFVFTHHDSSRSPGGCGGGHPSRPAPSASPRTASPSAPARRPALAAHQRHRRIPFIIESLCGVFSRLFSYQLRNGSMTPITRAISSLCRSRWSSCLWSASVLVLGLLGIIHRTKLGWLLRAIPRSRPRACSGCGSTHHRVGPARFQAGGRPGIMWAPRLPAGAALSPARLPCFPAALIVVAASAPSRALIGGLLLGFIEIMTVAFMPVRLLRRVRLRCWCSCSSSGPPLAFLAAFEEKI